MIAAKWRRESDATALAALPIPADDEGVVSNYFRTSVRVALPEHVRLSLVEKDWKGYFSFILYYFRILVVILVVILVTFQVLSSSHVVLYILFFFTVFVWNSDNIHRISIDIQIKSEYYSIDTYSHGATSIHCIVCTICIFLSASPRMGPD